MKTLQAQAEPTIKAIQTSYKGYRFRSRTEARWAVFFDAFEIKWQYELEGFHLTTGMYLPDFFLPEEDTWIEIKGVEPTQEEYSKVGALATESGKPAVVLWGVPEVPVGISSNGAAFSYGRDGLGKIRPFCERPVFCMGYLGGIFIAKIHLADITPCSPTGAPLKGLHCRELYMDPFQTGEHLVKFGDPVDKWYFGYACDKAKAARFEHGESGAP